MIGGCLFGCVGATVVDMIKNLMLQEKFKKEERTEEMQQAEKEARADCFKIIGACPCLCLFVIGIMVTFGMWIWGAVMAAEAHKCESGTTAFLISFIFLFFQGCIIPTIFRVFLIPLVAMGD
jgi:hypothetical protein